MLDPRSLTAFPDAEHEHDNDTVLASYDVDQVNTRIKGTNKA